jgi:hypothetical protein
MASAVRKFLALSTERQLMVVAAAGLQLAARCVIAAAGLRLALALATRLAASIAPKDVDRDTLAWALAASAARVKGTCLTQAIAARALLADSAVLPKGSAPAFVIGVRRRGGRRCAPEFHAWTEIEGATIPRGTIREAYVPVLVWS